MASSDPSKPASWWHPIVLSFVLGWVGTGFWVFFRPACEEWAKKEGLSMSDLSLFVEGVLALLFIGGQVWATLLLYQYRNLGNQFDKIKGHSDKGGFISVSLLPESQLSTTAKKAKISVQIRNQDPWGRRFGSLTAKVTIAKARGMGSVVEMAKFRYRDYPEGQPLPEYVVADVWVAVDSAPVAIATVHISDMLAVVCDSTGTPTSASMPLLGEPLHSIIPVTSDILNS